MSARGGGAVRTRRLVIVVVLAVMCTITLAPHVRLYVEQERQQAQLRERIAANEAAIAALEREQDLWNDDAFVAAQARERLHYVYPGETGYVVPPTLLVPDPDAVTSQGTVVPGRAGDGPWYRSLWAGLAEPGDSPADPIVEPAVEPGG